MIETCFTISGIGIHPNWMVFFSWFQPSIMQVCLVFLQENMIDKVTQKKIFAKTQMFLFKNSLPIFLKGAKEKDTNPNNLIMFISICCVFSCLCGKSFFVKNCHQWRGLIPITETLFLQAELATSHEVRWFKGSRWVVRCREQGKKVDHPWKKWWVGRRFLGFFFASFFGVGSFPGGTFYSSVSFFGDFFMDHLPGSAWKRGSVMILTIPNILPKIF